MRDRGPVRAGSPVSYAENCHRFALERAATGLSTELAECALRWHQAGPPFAARRQGLGSHVLRTSRHSSLPQSLHAPWQPPRQQHQLAPAIVNGN